MLELYKLDFQNGQATATTNAVTTFERTQTRTSASPSALLIDSFMVWHTSYVNMSERNVKLYHDSFLPQTLQFIIPYLTSELLVTLLNNPHGKKKQRTLYRLRIIWTTCRTFSSYRAVNIFRPGYESKSVRALYWSKRCLLWDKYRTHRYTLVAECTTFNVKPGGA